MKAAISTDFSSMLFKQRGIHLCWLANTLLAMLYVTVTFSVALWSCRTASGVDSSWMFTV